MNQLMLASTQAPAPIIQQHGELVWTGMLSLALVVIAALMLARWVATKLGVAPHRKLLIIGSIVVLITAVFIVPV